MRPSFLIIGAAKAGTTTLRSDLDADRGIFFPVTKEPTDLVRDEVLERRGLAKYQRLFGIARPGQILGEASTGYTARPMFEGAAERAFKVCGRALKLVYLVRDPLDRVLSEHRYLALLGKMPGDINVALRETPRVIERSRYAYQLEPWLERFALDNLRVIVFERYIAAREATVRSLLEFFGSEPDPDYRLPEGKNKTADVVVGRGPLQRIARSDFYRRTVRRIVPPIVRERAKQYLGRSPRVTVSQQLTRDNEQLLLDRLQPEVDRLHQMLGWASPAWGSLCLTDRDAGAAITRSARERTRDLPRRRRSSGAHRRGSRRPGS